MHRNSKLAVRKAKNLKSDSLNSVMSIIFKVSKVKESHAILIITE